MKCFLSKTRTNPEDEQAFCEKVDSILDEMDPDTCLVIAEGDERNVGKVVIYFFVKSLYEISGVMHLHMRSV